ncbi:MAG: purine-nucleoside phosphorylase [Planctomycetaceae bacterium]|nr:purine-nucleoside phosphorylase [Planctomycetaceae bacterium]
MAVAVFDDDTAEAVETVRTRLSPPGSASRTGIVLGSGLGAAAEQLLKQGGTTIPCEQIPGMPMPGVAGHGGRLVAGMIHGQYVVMLQGRSHFYEGRSLREITFGVRLLAALGVSRLVLTNAAGGIQSGMRPGDLMLINGHLTMAPVLTPAALQECGVMNPLPPDTEVGCRICPWDLKLQQLAMQVPTDLTLHSGIYAMMSGPNYETPAEIRMLRYLGADAVGMSTVPEAVVASLRGMQVLGVSCITNIAAGLSDARLDHSEVTATASEIESRFVRWLWEVLAGMA